MSEITLADVVGALHLPGEHIAVCTEVPGGPFIPKIMCVDDVMNMRPRQDRNVWFSACPLRGDLPVGAKGKAEDVTRWAALFADLDVKKGALPSLEAAHEVIGVLNMMLGTLPAFILSSGHGLQPIWLLDPDDPATDTTDPALRARAQPLMRRWGRLVARVCANNGAGRPDSVYNLDRVLRAPGTVNRKFPEAPVPASAVAGGGRPLTVDELEAVLDAFGVREFPEDADDVGVVVTPTSEWAWGNSTCAYVQGMVAGWTGDTPTGRHPWLVRQATRLAAAHRLGCITQKDYDHALRALSRRFGQLLKSKPAREIALREFEDAVAWGERRVEGKSEEAVRAELGNHAHSGGTRSREGEWPKIDPLLEGSLVPYPVDALPAGMAAAVREVAHAVQADPAIPAMAFLGAAAGLLGAWTKVKITPTWNRWCNLYLVVVAGTGNGKTPGTAPAWAPLYEFEERLQCEADQDKRRAKVLLPGLQKQLKELHNIGGKGSIAELEVVQAAIEEHERALGREARAVVDDVTPERLAELMDANEGRIVAVNDEGSLFKHLLGLYTTTPNLDPFLKGWDANRLTVDRKGGNGTAKTALVIPVPRLTLVAAVQPDTIRRIGEPKHRDLVERGVVGRVLPSWPPSTMGTRMLTGREHPPYTAVPAWNDALKGLQDGMDHLVRFGEGASEAFFPWHDHVEEGLPAGRAYHDVKEFAVKIRDSVPRIAGLFARLDGSDFVTADHVLRAIRLGEYHLAHAQAIVESWAGTEVGTAQKLLAKLETAPKVPECTDCLDPSAGYFFHVRDARRWVRSATTETIIEALWVLDIHGYVRPHDPNEGYGIAGRAVGKKSPHVIVNPAALR